MSQQDQEAEQRYDDIPTLVGYRVLKNEKDYLMFQTIGGRDIQEDCVFWNDNGNYKSCLLFDGFGGQSLAYYLRYNLQRISLSHLGDLKHMIDHLDQYIRSELLFRKEFRKCVVGSREYKQQVKKASGEVKSQKLVSEDDDDGKIVKISDWIKDQSDRENILNLVNQYQKTQDPSILYRIIERIDYYQSATEDKKVEVKPDEGLDFIIQQLQKCEELNHQVQEFKKSAKIDATVDPVKAELFEIYLNAIYLQGEPIRELFKKSVEGNTILVRKQLMEQTLQNPKYKKFWFNWNKEFYPKIAITQEERAKFRQKPHFSQYGNNRIKILSEFYRKDHKTLHEHLLYGWNLLLLALTKAYILDAYENQSEEWPKLAEELDLDHTSDEIEDDITEIHAEKFLAIHSIYHYIFRYIAENFQELSKFGDSFKLGTTVVGINLDYDKHQIQVAWRGDSVVLHQTHNDINLITEEHKPIKMSINVGRFIGGISNQFFYEENKCQETDSFLIDKFQKGDKLILLSDGAYFYYQRFVKANPSQKLFPDTPQAQISYMKQILKFINFHYEKEDDNSTFAIVTIPFDPLQPANHPTNQSQI